MSYRVWVHPQALAEAKSSPGHIRQRLKRAWLDLQQNPRPPASKRLDWPDAAFEPWRLRIEDWRIVYVINDENRWVEVLAVRKRPPYDYGDLNDLLSRVG